MNTKANCDTCFKIKCKNCGWEPDDKELKKVISGKITVCPTCKKSK